MSIVSSYAVGIQTVVTKATTDKAFATELKSAAAAAQKAGVGSAEWETLMGKFFTTPYDLAILKAVHSGDPRIDPLWTPTTITTITTITTAF